MSSIGLWPHGIMQHAGEAEFALFWPELDWLTLDFGGVFQEPPSLSETDVDGSTFLERAESICNACGS